MYKINNKNQLIKNNKLIKILEEDEIPDAEILIDALNTFELFPEDPEIDNLYEISEYLLKDTPFNAEDFQDLVIPLILIDDRYIIENILENENISDLMQRMSTNHLIVYDDRYTLEDYIDQIMEIPERIRSYIDYNSILNDFEMEGSGSTYSIKTKKGYFVINRFMVMQHDQEDYFNEFGI